MKLIISVNVSKTKLMYLLLFLWGAVVGIY